MAIYPTYAEAKAEAERRVKEWKRSQAVRRAANYSQELWEVSSVPNANKRFGWELRAEIVEVEPR